MLILILLLGVLHLSTGQNNTTNSTTPIYKKYYQDWSFKTTPLYYCDTAVTSHSLYRIPKPIKCDYLKLDRPSTVIEITLWFDLPTLQTTSAYYCNAVISSGWKLYDFFGSFSEHTDHQPRYVTQHECEEMIRTKVAPTGAKLLQLYPNLLSTDLKLDIKYQWPHLNEQTVINYYIHTITITKTNTDNTVVTNVPLPENCLLPNRTVELWILESLFGIPIYQPRAD